MSTEFNREERYIVFKLSDVEEHFTPGERQQLARLVEVQRAGREEAGKPLLRCVVVEKDWPEYEPTWRAIEARVAGERPAQKAVAYLDLGVGGYMDIGTDLTDEQIASLPKGRHMLGIVGTYGVDGYVSAQPTPGALVGARKVTRDFRWDSATQCHVPTLKVEFEPVHAGAPNDAKGWQDRDRIAAMLEAAPCTQPSPSFADAYQGAMEEVAIWKKRALEAEDLNRKFVTKINGPAYMGEPAQSAPSVPEGWLRAIDEALVVAHIGVANADDTYEQAKAKLDSLIGFHVDVAPDPAVNGGWKLVPVEPTKKMIKVCTYMLAYDGNSPQYIWAAMLAAAPEAKP